MALNGLLVLEEIRDCQRVMVNQSMEASQALGGLQALVHLSVEDTQVKGDQLVLV